MTFLKKPNYYIGHATDERVRYAASSGGIGTAIIQYLLSTDDFGTSVTYVFNADSCQYEPRLIHSAGEMNICGSIYQDIDIVKFIKQHVEEIKGGIVIVCEPCRVKALRALFDRKGIKSFILSFCCSGQTTIEGTWCYYRLLGIDKTNVQNMQYRGNGWPSGIQIWLKDGTKIYHDNYAEPWRTMHQSHLFRPRRCFLCKLDTGRFADISLADPWTDEYKGQDHIGNTLFLALTDEGQRIIEELSHEGRVECRESSYDEYAVAQKPNINKELRVASKKTAIQREINLTNKGWYHRWASKSEKRMHMHQKVVQQIYNFSSKQDVLAFMERRWSQVVSRMRYGYWKNKLGGHQGRFNMGGVKILNSKCVYLGKNVGIGDGSFIGPVVEYSGIAHNPRIIIGEGTWIGKHCSIAAIDRVEIGKHVLFAGYVHITDHSHGFEDITRPCGPQHLTSKGPVIIEDDCWLGFNAEILSGVHIGKHCVVGARAVVTKDVPPYSVVVGNPARVVKRYNQETKKWEKVK